MQKYELFTELLLEKSPDKLQRVRSSKPEKRLNCRVHFTSPSSSTKVCHPVVHTLFDFVTASAR